MADTPRWAGDASRLVQAIDSLAGRKGSVPIALLSRYVGQGETDLRALLLQMQAAKIVELKDDDHVGLFGTGS